MKVKVKILTGGYGYRPSGKGTVQLRTYGDIVEVAKEEGERLESCNAGKIVGISATSTVATAPAAAEKAGSKTTPPVSKSAKSAAQRKAANRAAESRKTKQPAKKTQPDAESFPDLAAEGPLV